MKPIPVRSRFGGAIINALLIATRRLLKFITPASVGAALQRHRVGRVMETPIESAAAMPPVLPITFGAMKIGPSFRILSPWTGLESSLQSIVNASPIFVAIIILWPALLWMITVGLVGNLIGQSKGTA